MKTCIRSIGFIGLGVMGEPICRNLAEKSGLPVAAFDLSPEPLRRLAASRVRAAGSVTELVTGVDLIFLCLPSGEAVEAICRAPGGILDAVRRGQVIVDLSTSPVDLTRRLGETFQARGVRFADAPIARTRAAAETGTLSIMVGADPELFDSLRPLLEHFGSDVTRCGPLGCGQVVKILNNMILFETVVALSEAKAIAERSGVDAALLFETLCKGSADSFALRSHGMKSILTQDFPTKAFSVEYARKDLRYALQLAEQTAVDARGARVVDGWFEQAVASGHGGLYPPVVSRQIAGTRDERP